MACADGDVYVNLGLYVAHEFRHSARLGASPD